MNCIRPCHVVLALLAGTLTAGPADAWNMGPMYRPSVPIDLVACNCGMTGPHVHVTPNIPRGTPGFGAMGAPIVATDAARRRKKTAAGDGGLSTQAHAKRHVKLPKRFASAAAKAELQKIILSYHPARNISDKDLKAIIILAIGDYDTKHGTGPSAPSVVSSPEPVPAPSTTVSAPPPGKIITWEQKAINDKAHEDEMKQRAKEKEAARRAALTDDQRAAEDDPNGDRQATGDARGTLTLPGTPNGTEDQ
jgi:hypothetical protein